MENIVPGAFTPTGRRQRPPCRWAERRAERRSSRRSGNELEKDSGNYKIWSVVIGHLGIENTAVNIEINNILFDLWA